MKDDEKSLLPQMSTPVERKLFGAPSVREDGAAVQPSDTGYYARDCVHWCRDARDRRGCINRCNGRTQPHRSGGD